MVRRYDVGVTAKDHRLFVDAVLYRYRAGIPWRDLPERYGPWKDVHTRFTRWAKRGVWATLFQHLAEDRGHRRRISHNRQHPLRMMFQKLLRNGDFAVFGFAGQPTSSIEDRP